MNYGKASEVLTVIGTIDPQTVVNTELFSDVVDMSKFGQVFGIALLGNMAAETIDFKCYRCASDGTSAVALKSATQLAASATANDNAQVVINVRAEELESASADARYVKFGLVTGGAAGGPATVLALGVDARQGLAADLDLASVLEIKS